MTIRSNNAFCNPLTWFAMTLKVHSLLKGLSLHVFQSSKDLVCLQKLDFVEVYSALGWKKKYKSPTEHGFALKVSTGS